MALRRRCLRALGRGRHKASLNFGDCLAYATAASTADSLLYVGDDFRHTNLPSARYRRLRTMSTCHRHLRGYRLARTIHEGPNSPLFELRLRPDARAFAQGSSGRRLEHRAERGVETGGRKRHVAGGAL